MKTQMLFCILFIVSTCLFSTIINVPADQPTIQSGIDAATDTDTVLVADGTYFENINFEGKAITVASNYIIDANTLHIENTIINGCQPANPNYASVVKFDSGESSTSVLSGFTLTEGTGSFEPGVGMFGGGISIHDSSPTLENLIIKENVITGVSGGSGIYCSMSSPTLHNIAIHNNASGWGSGIFCYGYSTPSLVNVTISDNSAETNGGGIFCNYYVSMSLENVTIYGNSTDGYGGAICCWSNSNPNLVNVTLTDNSAVDGGSGISCWNNSVPDLINCILWNDLPDEIHIESASITVEYSDIQGGWFGEGNIDDDPLFVGTGDHPFSIQDLSPCVNAGTPDTTGLNLPEFDLAGNPRVYGGRIDMGAYENQNVVVNADEDLIPLITKLNKNYPNPFNPTTTINYSLKENSKVSLNIYNIKGQKVKQIVNEVLTAGEHSIVWDGTDNNNKSISSGIYFYKMKTENHEETKKMILMK